MPLTAAEIAQTQVQLAALRAAIRSGVRSVQYGDRSTTYQSLAEMRETERELAGLLHGRGKQTLVVGAKGFA